MLREVKAQIEAEIKKKLEAASHEAARKNIGEAKIPDEVLEKMSKFQALVNFIFERGIRESFERSVDKFIENFEEILNFLADSFEVPKEKIKDFELTIERIRKVADDAIFKHRMKRKLRLKCELKYKPENGVYISPRINIWKTEILKLIDELIKLIIHCPCLFSSELGYSRESREILVIADPETDSFAVSRKEKLANILDNILFLPEQLQKVAGKYKEILEADISVIKEKFNKDTITNEEYNAELLKLKEAQERLNSLLPEDTMFCGLFEVNCKKVRELFNIQLTKLNKCIGTCVKSRISQDSDNIEDGVKEVTDMLEKEPPDIENLVEQNKFIQALETKRANIHEIIVGVFRKITLLENYQISLTDKEFDRAFTAFTRTLEIERLKRAAQVRNAALWGDYKDRLKAETSVLLIDIGQLKEKLDQLMLKTDLKEYDKISYEYNQLGEKISECISRSDQVINREKLFLQTPTSFDELYNTKKLFMPYEEMWNITRDYNYHYPQWTTGPIADLDRDKLMEEVNTSIEKLKKSIGSDFLTDPKTQQIASITLQHFIDFKPMLPLIYDLRNPAMQKRHWEALKSLTFLIVFHKFLTHRMKLI